MKKFIFILVMILALVGCQSKSEEAAMSTGVVNPYVEVESIDKMNEVCKTHIKAVENCSDEVFITINGQVADYRFTYQGASCSLRAGYDEEDISGIYVKDGTVFSKAGKELTTVEVEDGFACRWFIDDEQFVLYVQGDESVFNELKEKIAD